MMTPEHKINRTILGLLFAVSSCGPDPAQTASATDTSTGDDASSTDSPTGSPTGSSTGTPEPCSRVHEGDLYVLDDTDLASLADIGRVTGKLAINMDERDQRDLSFLGCLHTIDHGIDLTANKHLESTEGLEKLKAVQSIKVIQNENLRVLTGFDGVTEISWLVMYKNPALEEIQLDSIKTVKQMTIGQCQGTMAVAGHLALVDLAGFNGLATVEDLIIDGNEALLSADLLDALAANGASKPLASATIRLNPLLTEATIHARLDAIGVPFREVCGNAGGDPGCFCPIGE